jgi:putative transposase
MKERMRFVTDWERGLYSMVELCARYGVSRKTGYKWLLGQRGMAAGAEQFSALPPVAQKECLQVRRLVCYHVLA